MRAFGLAAAAWRIGTNEFAPNFKFGAAALNRLGFSVNPRINLAVNIVAHHF